MATMRRLRWFFAVLIGAAAFSSPAFARYYAISDAACQAAGYTTYQGQTYKGAAPVNVYNNGSGGWGNQCVVWGGCPSPLIETAGGVCGCSGSDVYDSTQDLCVPPPAPDCSAGQTADSNGQCQPDTPEPAIGTSSQGFITVCDANCDSMSNWADWPTRSNCGGWKCVVDQPGQCAVLTSGQGGCYTTITYEGMGAADAATTAIAASPPTGGTTNVQQQTLTCPTGFTLDVATSTCKSAGTSGSTATTTSAGTAGTSGATSCPVGYAANASGVCVQQNSGGTYSGCPTGYTRDASGQCVGSSSSGAGTIPGVYGSAAGTGPNSVGSCGGPGQAKCAVTIDGPQSDAPITGADASGVSKADADGAVSGLVSAMGNWGVSDPASSWKTDFKNSWGDWFETIPMTGCSAFSSSVGGFTWSFDPCPVAAKVSIIAEYAMWISFSIGVFLLILGDRNRSA